MQDGEVEDVIAECCRRLEAGDADSVAGVLRELETAGLERILALTKRGVLGHLVNIYTVGQTDRASDLGKAFGLGFLSRRGTMKSLETSERQKAARGMLRKIVRNELDARK